MDVGEWLRGLGLVRYTQSNNIDDRVLRRLTVEDLRDLGVASIGHRRRRGLLFRLGQQGLAGPICQNKSPKGVC